MTSNIRNTFKKLVDQSIDGEIAYFWSHQEAVEFASRLEKVAMTVDHHVALTGGCLYGHYLYGADLRKDCDIIIYSRRQSTLDTDGLLKLFADKFGMFLTKKSDWLTKALLPNGKSVDFLCPEVIKNGEDNY